MIAIGAAMAPYTEPARKIHAKYQRRAHENTTQSAIAISAPGMSAVHGGPVRHGPVVQRDHQESTTPTCDGHQDHRDDRALDARDHPGQEGGPGQDQRDGHDQDPRARPRTRPRERSRVRRRSAAPRAGTRSSWPPRGVDHPRAGPDRGHQAEEAEGGLAPAEHAVEQG